MDVQTLLLKDYKMFNVRLALHVLAPFDIQNTKIYLRNWDGPPYLKDANNKD
jgi:hypothetical protein